MKKSQTIQQLQELLESNIAELIKTKKENETHKSLLDAGLSELQFANLQIEALYGALDEIVSMTNDPLAKEVARMAKERHQTDKLINARLIF